MPLQYRVNRATQTALHTLADSAGAGDTKSRNNRPQFLSNHYNSTAATKTAINLDFKDHGDFRSLDPVGVALGRAIRAGDIRTAIKHERFFKHTRRCSTNRANDVKCGYRS